MSLMNVCTIHKFKIPVWFLKTDGFQIVETMIVWPNYKNSCDPRVLFRLDRLLWNLAKLFIGFVNRNLVQLDLVCKTDSLFFNQNLFFFNFPGPFTEYKIWVKAYTWKNEGLQSDSVRYKTDVGGPLPPAITNLTCQSNNTLYVEWKRPRPADYYISVDQYFVIYRSSESNDYEEKIINSSEAFDNVTGLVSIANNDIKKKHFNYQSFHFPVVSFFRSASEILIIKAFDSSFE